MSTSPQLAFVTLVTSNSYLPGALVVAAALQDAHSSPPAYPDEYDPSEFDRVCLVTPETLNVDTIKQLRRAFDVVIGVEVIEEDTEEGLKLLGRLDLRTVLTKLHVFRLTSYRKIIFLDADVLTLRPISHLFRISASLAAVPDVGWPDIFNSGFFVLEPSETKFTEIMEVVKSRGSWDGGDQGVLNEWAGQNWDRLSFTYNTTPTAVYTYAPAYERFGSQISNIHFIGPNKPWLEIPSRVPGASSSTSPPALTQFEPPSSYRYPALLDRWFAIYDKHYRSTPAPLQSIPATKLNELLSTLTEVPEVQRYINVWDSDIQITLGNEGSGGSAPLGLEELRRLALEGVGKSETGDGEGTYRSLPLEGRIDLMRPQKIKTDSETTRPRVVTLLLPEDPQTPEKFSSPMTTLPTPAPHELPPAPVFRGHSLPPETPTHARPGAEAVSFITPERDYLQPYARRSSPTFDMPSPSASFGHPATPPRHESPPLIIWNPAVEAPPNIPPPSSHFPEDTYFPNVWDARSHGQPTLVDHGGLFPVPPPPSIPEMLIKEGHYQAVIGISKHEEAMGQPHQEEQTHHQPHQEEQTQHQPHQGHQTQHQPQDQPAIEVQFHRESYPTHQSSHPQPNRSKVAAVFPWEEKPRHAPVRFFPPTDSPPPGLAFIQPQSPTLKLNLPQPPVHGAPRTSLSHSQSFPRTTTYANAWDSVPSIQRYASRLISPTPPFLATSTPDIGSIKKGSVNSYQRWQDLAEVSSRDADDEDEDEDEDNGRFNGEVRSELSQTSGEPSPSFRKSYRGKGIQTVPTQTKNQSVQVPYEDRKHAARPVLGNTDQQERNNFETESTSQDRDRSDMSLTTSTETSEVAKTVSSSPPDSATTQPGPQSKPVPAPRPAGRIFDPARDIDIFKKGSEEVLARFLKVASWEEATHSDTISPVTI